MKEDFLLVWLNNELEDSNKIVSWLMFTLEDDCFSLASGISPAICGVLISKTSIKCCDLCLCKPILVTDMHTAPEILLHFIYQISNKNFWCYILSVNKKTCKWEFF